MTNKVFLCLVDGSIIIYFCSLQWKYTFIRAEELQKTITKQ